MFPILPTISYGDSSSLTTSINFQASTSTSVSCVASRSIGSVVMSDQPAVRAFNSISVDDSGMCSTSSGCSRVDDILSMFESATITSENAISCVNELIGSKVPLANVLSAISNCKQKLESRSCSDKAHLVSVLDICMMSIQCMPKDDVKCVVRDMPPRARALLNAFENATINVNDIIPARRELIGLSVPREVVSLAIRRCRHRIRFYNFQNKEAMLSELDRSGHDVHKIKRHNIKYSNELQCLLDASKSGIMSLDQVPRLKNLLSREVGYAQVARKIYRVKHQYITTHPNESLEDIEAAFKTVSSKTKVTDDHIRSIMADIGPNMPLEEFIKLYNSVPMAQRSRVFRDKCLLYVCDKARQQKTIIERRTFFNVLPQYLSKSDPVFNSLCYEESIIRNKIIKLEISPHDLLSAMTKLVLVTNPKYCLRLCSLYVKKKHGIGERFSIDETALIYAVRAHLRNLDLESVECHSDYKYNEEMPIVGDMPIVHSLEIPPILSFDDELDLGPEAIVSYDADCYRSFK